MHGTHNFMTFPYLKLPLQRFLPRPPHLAINIGGFKYLLKNLQFYIKRRDTYFYFNIYISVVQQLQPETQLKDISYFFSFSVVLRVRRLEDPDFPTEPIQLGSFLQDANSRF